MTNEDVAVLAKALDSLTEGWRPEYLAALDRLQARLEAAEAEDDEKWEVVKKAWAERDEAWDALLNAERDALAESEALVAERDEARADAERLRKAGRKLLDGLPSQEATATWREAVRLHEALAAHEEVKRADP